MQTVIVGTNQAGQRFDKFLHKCLPEAGSGFLYKMLRKKNITLNGKKADGKEMLAVGDEVNFFFSDETYAKFSGTEATSVSMNDSSIHGSNRNMSGQHAQNPNNENSFGLNATNTVSRMTQEYLRTYKTLKNIEVIYEDENVVMLNKPVGVLTQKAKPEDISLNEWLIGYLLEKEAITETELRTFHPSVCNRLDRNTSGLVLCGKSLPGSQALSRVIKERTIRKFYHTICMGEIRKDAVIDGYLYKDEKTNKVTVVHELPHSPKGTKGTRESDYSPIRTAYHPLAVSNGFTLLEVELITGKTHQIRSHLASIGHPIIGDGKYGNKKCNLRFREEYSLKNQMLHAHHVIFGSEEGTLEQLSQNTVEACCPKLFDNIVGLLFPNYKNAAKIYP